MTDDPVVPGGLYLADGHVLSGDWSPTGPDDDLPPDARRHYLEPTEVIPLCMVAGTWTPAPVDEVCVVVRSPEGVTCDQCDRALGARSGLPLPLRPT